MDINRMKQEKIARILVFITILLVLITIAIGADKQNRMLIKGSMPEQGGWQPGNISAQVGVPLKLHLTSEDVVHGFAIGQFDVPEVEVLPGIYTEFEITFDEPGTYTYYCTTWCGPNHWRMRGTIKVESPNDPADEVKTTPLYITLGIDIDGDHEADYLPSRIPSALLGDSLKVQLSDNYYSADYYYSSSPAKIFTDLRDEESLEKFQDGQIWNLVAALYWKSTSMENITEGQQLYTDNCAACHGVTGQGDGVFAKSDEFLSSPVAFSENGHMLGSSPALLQGKIIRGGMGTGMPYWGTIFTERETWSLVSYIFSFQFKYPLDN
jgi:plastocyanin